MLILQAVREFVRVGDLVAHTHLGAVGHDHQLLAVLIVKAQDALDHAIDLRLARIGLAGVHIERLHHSALLLPASGDHSRASVFREQQPGVGVRRDVLHERPRSPPSGSFRRSHRETCVTTGGLAKGPTLPSTCARRSTRAGAPSWRVKTGGTFVWASPRPAAARMAVTVSGSSSWFLAEKASSDGGTTTTRPSSPLPGVRLPGEHDRLGRLEVGAQEVPGVAAHGVRRVETHVAPPHHAGAVRPQRRAQGGGLRVVEQHYVAGAHDLRKLFGASLRDPLVDDPLSGDPARRRRRAPRGGGCGSAW